MPLSSEVRRDERAGRLRGFRRKLLELKTPDEFGELWSSLGQRD